MFCTSRKAWEPRGERAAYRFLRATPGGKDTDPRDPLVRCVLMRHYRYSRTLERCEVLHEQAQSRQLTRRERQASTTLHPPGRARGCGGRRSPPLPSRPPLTWGRCGGSSWRRQLSTRPFWTLRAAR